MWFKKSDAARFAKSHPPKIKRPPETMVDIRDLDIFGTISGVFNFRSMMVDGITDVYQSNYIQIRLSIRPMGDLAQDALHIEHFIWGT